MVDCFDNHAGRRAVTEACRSGGIPCLHAGLDAEYAEVVWNELYRVPEDAEADVCDYPLARNLVVIAAAVAAEELVRFAAGEPRRSVTFTLKDLAIRPFCA